MCYNCGCGNPKDDHEMGHMGVDPQGKAFTDKSLDAMGKAFNMNIEDSKKNICDLFSSE